MTIMKEGALASFYTVNKAPIKHLRVYFSPKQAGTGDPSPSNVREISGWNELNLTTTSKSIWPFQKNTRTLSYAFNGYAGWGATSNLTGFKIPDRSVTYIYSAYIDNTNSTESARTKIWMRDITNSNWVHGIAMDGTIISAGTSGWSYCIFNPAIRPEAYYLGFGYSTPEKTIISNPMVEIGSITTEYELYKGSMRTIDWSNDIGTVYGGYVDLITGELVETWGSVNLGSINTWYVQTYENSKWFRATLPTEVWQNTWRPNVTSSLNNHPPHFLIDRFKIVSGASIYYGTSGDNVLGMDWLATIRIKCDSYNDDIDAFKAAINGKILYYEYATPITHQLTPTQLQTLIGRNNIWSNADRVEVEYDLAESNDELYRRRNIILQSALHIETASGAIANFSTDLAAPLKECKISFSPIQEGSGDPSPSNVRPITGWNTVSTTLCGKNLFNVNRTEGTPNPIDLSNATSPRVMSVDKYYVGLQSENYYYKNYTVATVSNGTVSVTNKNNNSYGVGFPVQVKSSTKYVLSFTAEKSLVSFGYYDKNWNYLSTSSGNTGSNPRIITTPANTYYMTVVFRAPQSETATYTYSNIQLEEAESASVYEVYKGTTYPVTFPAIKNLFDINQLWDNGIDRGTGEIVRYYKMTVPNGKYTVSTNVINNSTPTIASVFATHELVTPTSHYDGVFLNTPRTITVSNEELYVFIRVESTSGYLEWDEASFDDYYIQVESGQTATQYEPYRTIYGGYVDLINGELVQTHIALDLGTIDWNYYNYSGHGGGYAYKYSSILQPNNAFSLPDAYCSKLQVCSDNYFNSINNNGYQVNINELSSIKVTYDEATDASTLKSLLTGTILICELKNPNHQTISPQTLKTLKGTNNIWSNANGPVEISYWTH